MKNIKGRSIKWNIIISFSLAMIVSTAVTYLLVHYISKSVLEKTVRNYLISAVDSNIDEVAFKKETKKNTSDIYIEYSKGYLAIDYDFLDVMHEVESGLYTEDGTILYGKNPIANEASNVPFSTSHIYKQEIAGEIYYIYDRKITENHLEGLWIRGMVPIMTEIRQLTDITKVMIWFIPLIIITAVIVGYLLAGRLLRPIQKMEKVASEISKGTDLKKRIDLGPGNDELHRLADVYNEMIERLDNSFEAERRFTSDASHELRTPMSVIMAQTELTLEKERSIGEYQAALGVIERQGGRMNRLIDMMLDYTRLEQRAKDYPLEKINLSELTTSICEDMKLIRNKGITLTADIEPELYVMGNQLLLSRMLQNLIDNAYKYGKDEGNIKVILNTNKDSFADGFILSVKDNGIGMSKETQGRIFERFYREDASRTNLKSQVHGYGLGLSMVKKIVEMHSGTVSVESIEGEGSTFTVIFPKSR